MSFFLLVLLRSRKDKRRDKNKKKITRHILLFRLNFCSPSLSLSLFALSRPIEFMPLLLFMGFYNSYVRCVIYVRHVTKKHIHTIDCKPLCFLLMNKNWKKKTI